MSNAEEVVKKLPKPTNANKPLFAFVQCFLEAAARAQRISITSTVADCVAAHDFLADIIEQWPLTTVGSAWALYEDWERWAHDLKELSLDKQEVYQRLQEAKETMQRHIASGGHRALKQLKRLCPKVDSNVEKLWKICTTANQSSSIQ